NQYIHSGCIHPEGETCPMASNLPVQSYAGFTLDFLIAGFGIFLVYKSRQSKKFVLTKRENIEKTLKELDGDEKKIYELISNSDGVIFQSDIVEKTQFSKVKVTRILDRMEHRGLVERRRRGMSNIVLLKK
ncbi:MAG: MarR family transcriptional regulator, partial [Candidatus Aenigmatarchaeota archaeon]